MCVCTTFLVTHQGSSLDAVVAEIRGATGTPSTMTFDSECKACKTDPTVFNARFGA